jgi:hypothetical protein
MIETGEHIKVLILRRCSRDECGLDRGDCTIYVGRYRTVIAINLLQQPHRIG